LHRLARIATLVGLAGGALAIIVLLAWASHTRASWKPVPGIFDPGRSTESFVARGLKIIAHHPEFPHAAIVLGALAAIALALAFLIWRGQRWAYIVAAVGAAITIAGPWLARAYVQHIETVTASRKWAAKSPYVAATTTLALALTIVLALLAAASVTAFVTSKRVRA